MPVEDSRYICLSIRLINSALKRITNIIHKFFWKTTNILLKKNR